MLGLDNPIHLAFILVLRTTMLRHKFLGYAILTTAALTTAAILQHIAPPESPALQAAAITRYYWFLSQWQWFELLGLVGGAAPGGGGSRRRSRHCLKRTSRPARKSSRLPCRFSFRRAIAVALRTDDGWNWGMRSGRSRYTPPGR